jgi:hypothetical protein
MPVTVSEITKFLAVIRKAYGAKALHDLVDQVDRQHKGVDPPSLPTLESAEDLIADAGRLPPMLVDRLLPDHSLFLLTGKPKAGKSFLALDIADSISRGAPVFGQLHVSRPGPVLYLAMEDGKPEIARRLSQRSQTRKPPSPSEERTSGRGAGTREAGGGGEVTSNLYFATEAFSLTDALNLARIRELAADIPDHAGSVIQNPKSKIPRPSSS